MPRVSPRNPETDPAALLGKHLRRVRIAAGYKIQDPFAAAAHISQDQISRAETGNQPPTDELFDVWMKLCGVTDPELEWFKDTLKLARNSKGLVVEGFEPWPGTERLASFTRSWCPMLVPGLLQVAEYALPLFYSMGKSNEKAAELLNLRLSRQDILTGPDPVTGVFVIEESVLFRLVGSPAAMVKQLDRMLALSEQPTVTIQIVRGAASLAGMFGQFDIVSGPDIPDTMLMWAVRDQTTDDSALVREAIMIFELIRGRALNVEESRAVAMEARQHWKSQQ
jgi:hypothetical protein